MAKRGVNIYKRKDGRWEGRYKNGYRADGKAKYSSVYGKNYSAVKEKLDVKRAELNKGATVCKCTFGELAGIWLVSQKNAVKESSYACYEMKLNKHILPCFAGVKYEDMTADKIYSFMETKKSDGLSVGYISDIVTVMKSIAKFAAKMYGYANKLEFVSLPKKSTAHNAKMLTSEEQSTLRAALAESNSPSDMGILLASVTGIRIGELCSLKWSDIDFGKNILTVSRTVQRIKNVSGEKKTKLNITEPKSKSSVREIPLPKFIMPFLRKLKSSDGEYILSCSDKIIEPRTMQYRFTSLLKKLNLPSVHFHSLRHAFATTCIAIGFDVKTLSEILGHSSVEVTLNRYVHSSIERKRACMDMLSA